jgi:thioredoxin reductase
MLRMNAHLENYPGFPAGVNPRLLLDMMEDQAETHGCEIKTVQIDDVDRHPDGGFVLSRKGFDKFEYRTDHLIAATGGNVDYLRNLDLEIVEQDHGAYVDCEENGRTSIEGLYVAGGLANKPLQAVISAGHGAEVALAILKESETEFVHDWSVPDGFFTDTGQDILPGSEEVTESAREEREQHSLEEMQSRFAEVHPDEPPT